MTHNSFLAKNILLGVTGGIAAYKIPELVRLFKKAGANVRVILSQGAKDFVTPLTLATLSGERVYEASWELEEPMLHIDLARWADLFLIAPLSANRLSALAHGQADDLITTTYLATKAPLWVAPAMNTHMWHHPATQSNVAVLRQRGVSLLGPDEGEQACKDVGLGRMLEPEAIVQAMGHSQVRCLQDKKIVITAGPTREMIDPVRFLSNRSSGKMGYALAEQAQALGAKVILVSGPVALKAPSGVETLHVETAQDMLDAVMTTVSDGAIFIGAAAVSDYRPLHPSASKIKKQGSEAFILQCERNPDILAEVASHTKAFCVGFAAETDDLEYHALKKLNEKKIDMIALNAVNQPHTGFEHDTNALTVYWSNGQKHLALATKRDIAHQLLLLVSEKYDEKANRS